MARWAKNGNAAVVDYVPSDNNDLVRHYEPFVTRLVTRYNRVSTNFKDLLQHVWMKLIEVKIIEKYEKSCGTLPKTMTATQACSYLGMKFQAFKFAIYRHQVGDDRVADALRAPKAITNAVFERDHGNCWRCGQDMDRFQRVLTAMRTRDAGSLDGEFQSISVQFADETVTISVMPKKVTYTAFRQRLKDEYGITPWHRVFWFAERVPGTFNRTSADSYRTTCLFCHHKINPITERVRRKSAWAPMPIQGGYGSQKAVYNTEDIERFKAMREETKSRKSKTALVKTEAVSAEVVVFQPQRRTLFKLYLARTVHNIFVNWCRTRSRRYKEEYHGDREDGSSWDSFLEDARCRPDDMVDLYHTSKLLVSGEGDIRSVDFNSKDLNETQEKLLTLLADGYTLSEVVTKLALSPAVLKAVAF